MTDALPDVWGADQLLAFSGVDGPTDWARPFVLSTGSAPCSLQVRLPVSAVVTFDGVDGIAWEMILGDVLRGTTPGGTFRAAFADHDTLIGAAPAGSVMRVDGTPVTDVPAMVVQSDAVRAGTAKSGAAQLWAVQIPEAQIPEAQGGTRWALWVRFEDGAPAGRAASPMPGTPTDLSLADAPLDDIIAARAAWVRDRALPSHLSDSEARLLRKALSVMKVNVHAAQGCIAHRWSTPDRWPHQHMWLWDSAFHAVGMCRVDPELAQDEVQAMLDQVGGDGMLAHTIHPDGTRSAITQPPILAWAALQVLDHGGDMDWARACLEPLRRYLAWDRDHRDRNDNGLPEWFIEGNPLCRCGESGLDNSSVYDKAVLLDAPDFAAFLANDHRCLAEIARRLGEDATATEADAAAARIGDAVEALLWSDRHGLYCHRTFEGEHVPVKAISGFMPLFAGLASPKRAAELAAQLDDPATFGAPAPVPSESLDSGTYCKDMWRGPTWMNLSYMVWLGLRRYGHDEAARHLRASLLHTVGRWYETEGCLFEYYDSLAVTSPRDLDRKQRLISGRGIAPIADYHWTAAVTVALLLETPEPDTRA